MPRFCTLLFSLLPASCVRALYEWKEEGIGKGRMFCHSRQLLLLALLFSFPSVGSAQLIDWQNPRVFDINKLPARATAYSFATEADALSLDRSKTDRVLNLNGTWDFNFSAKPAEVPADFLAPKFKDWKPIEVPTNWEMIT